MEQARRFKAMYARLGFSVADGLKKKTRLKVGLFFTLICLLQQMRAVILRRMLLRASS